MKGFKTVAYGILLALSTFLASDSPEAKQFIMDNLAWLGPSAGLVVVVLRAVTNSPIFKDVKDVKDV